MDKRERFFKALNLDESDRVPIVDVVSLVFLEKLTGMKDRVGTECFNARIRAYTGDIWNVCHSLLVGSSLLGASIYVARPKSYNPDSKILRFAEEKSAKTGRARAQHRFGT